MKIISFYLIFFLSIQHGVSQTALLHTANAKNTAGHITTIDNPASNNKSNVILIINQRNDKVSNSNEIGVWYNQGKWKIFNQNLKPIPANSQFNVLILDPKQVTSSFVHTVTKSNTSAHVTNLSHKLTNGKKNASILVTQNYGKYNTSPVGVWYNINKWTIYNEDKTPMPIGTKFNVFVYNSQNLKGKGNIAGYKTMKHNVKAIKVGRKTMKIVSSKLDDVFLNGKTNRFVFFTQNFIGKYNANSTSVKFQNKSWSINNLNKRSLPAGLQYNVYALETQLTTMLYAQPATVNMTLKNPTTTKKTNPKSELLKNAVFDRSKVYIIPKFTGTTPKPSEDEEEITYDIKGPNMDISGLILLDDVFNDEDYDIFLDKLNIGRTVYWDANLNSNTIYYLPAKYNLDWNKETGMYGFSTFYLSAQEGDRGQVLVSAELTPSVDKDDIAFTEKLLSGHFSKEIKLRPMILSDVPEVEFGQELLTLDVDQASITVSMPQDFLDPIVVHWNMGSRVDDLVALMKERFGITGKVNFKPFSEEPIDKQSDIVLKLNDGDTYGVFEYANAANVLNGIENKTDYPIILQNLVVLRERSNKTLFVEEIVLNSYEVQPAQYFGDFSQGEKDQLVQGDVIKKIWLDYSLKQPCPECDEIVGNKILSGTSAARANNIEITVLNPIEHLDAYAIKLYIKSIQGDPKGDNEVTYKVDIKEDNVEISGGELFYTETDTPSFNYQIVLIQKDGNVLTTEWLPHTSLDLIIGSALMDLHFNQE